MRPSTSLFLLAIALAGAGACGEQHVDLFACEVSYACEPFHAHLGPEPHEALVCAAKLIQSGEPGVLSALDDPGPHLDQTDRLIIARGDGTALVQSRHRACEECDPLPDWEAPSAHEICEFHLNEEFETTCELGECLWSPWGPGGFKNCRAVEDFSCTDVAAILK